jgi:probable addiction module antidote protein
MSIETYLVDIAAELKTEKDIEGFIEASIEEAKNDTDPKYLIHALETAARARGMLTTAVEAEVDRANLYRILSGETDPRASTLVKIANALGYRLTLVKQPIDIKGRAAASM